MTSRRAGPRIALVLGALALALVTASAGVASAQPASWQEANRLRAEASQRMAAGDYDGALPLLEQSLAVSERLAEPIRTEYVVVSLQMLVMPYARKRDYPKVEGAYKRIVEETEKTKGPKDPAVAVALDQLGQLYVASGQHGRAEPAFARAMSILEAAGPAHAVSLGRVSNNLANLHVARGDFAKAEPLLEKAVAIAEKALGPTHPGLAASLTNQAVVLHRKGDLAKARALYERACPIYDAAGPVLAADAARCAQSHGAVLVSMGEYAKAAPLYERSRATWEKLLGPRHPHVARALNAIAQLAEARGDVAGAVATLGRANDIQDDDLELLLAAGSEGQKRDFLKTLAMQTEGTLSLQTGSAKADSTALRLALRTVLRRKGRVIDAMSAGLAAIRKRGSPEDAKVFDALAKARSELAAITLGTGGAPGPGPAGAGEARSARIDALEKEIDRLDADLAKRSAEYRVSSRPVTVEKVALAIPAKAALIELAVFRPYNSKWKKMDEVWAPERYVAYRLDGRGDVAWVDLGAAAAIDEAVGELRKALSKPGSDTKTPARALDERVGRPIRKLLPAGAEHVLIAPDGALHLLPFGALVDEGGKHLVETLSFTYLTSGRDLLRRDVRVEPRSAPAVLANPAFDAGPAKAKESDTPFGKAVFTPLPGTEEEALAISKLLPGAKLSTGEQVTEAALKSLRAPRVVHVATHGFFLSERATASRGSRGLVLDDAAPAAGPAGQAGAAGAAPPTSALPQEDALVRSGLALAGANKHVSGDDDGVLTALEATGLDLWGTQLVVLSACETGVGEIRTGDGVVGLRRALVHAGAESQVMSLWKVDDEATRDLMIDFYERLVAGEGRTEALRRAQLALLASKTHQHPYYWAAFIPSGDWSPMKLDAVATGAGDGGAKSKVGVDGAKPTAPSPVPPGARGCGCDTAGASSQRGTWIAALLGALIALVLARRVR